MEGEGPVRTPCLTHCYPREARLKRTPLGRLQRKPKCPGGGTCPRPQAASRAAGSQTGLRALYSVGTAGVWGLLAWI